MNFKISISKIKKILPTLRIILGSMLVGITVFSFYRYGEWRGIAIPALHSKVISAESITSDRTLQGEPISVTGVLTSKGKIGDGLFLRPGNYIGVDRTVEMYQWNEDINWEINDQGVNTWKIGNPPFVYKKEWNAYDPRTADTPEDHPEYSASHIALGHENPPRPLELTTTSATTSAYVGAYEIKDPSNFSYDVYPYERVALSGQNVNLAGSRAKIANEDYIFLPRIHSDGSLSDPKIGDVRISYFVHNTGQIVTVLGKLDGSSISPYHCSPQGMGTHGSECTLYKMYSNGETRDQILSDLYSNEHSGYYFEGIILLEGSMLLFFGLLLVLYPLGVLRTSGITGTIGRILISLLLTFALVGPIGYRNQSSILKIIPRLLDSTGIIPAILAAVLAVSIILFAYYWKKSQ